MRTVAGEDVLVSMRPQDGAALTVTLSVGDDTVIAAISKVVDNTRLPSREGQDRTVWSIRVAAATDLAMV